MISATFCRSLLFPRLVRVACWLVVLGAGGVVVSEARAQNAPAPEEATSTEATPTRLTRAQRMIEQTSRRVV
ncbi:MAG: hypothetical protein ACKOGA_11450, partial [Planctomycetaceae bacterium]